MCLPLPTPPLPPFQPAPHLFSVFNLPLRSPPLPLSWCSYHTHKHTHTHILNVHTNTNVNEMDIFVLECKGTSQAIEQRPDYSDIKATTPCAARWKGNRSRSQQCCWTFPTGRKWLEMGFGSGGSGKGAGCGIADLRKEGRKYSHRAWMCRTMIRLVIVCSTNMAIRDRCKFFSFHRSHGSLHA